MINFIRWFNWIGLEQFYFIKYIHTRNKKNNKANNKKMLNTKKS